MDPIFLDVVLHSDHDDLLRENEELRLRCDELQIRLDNCSHLIADNFALRDRLRSAKRILDKLGIDSSFCDR